MNILMVLEVDFPEDIRVSKEIKTLQDAGHTVSLACYTMRKREKKEVVDGLTIYRKPISSFIYKSSVGALKFPFYFNFWRSFLNSILSSNSFDAIHIHDLPLVKVGVEMKREFGVKLVLDLHENWPSLLAVSKHTNTFLGKLLSSDAQWRNYERTYVPKVDKLIVVAEEMKERMVKGGVKINNYSVVPNTIYLSTYSQLSSEKKADTLRLFYAGGLTYHRGLSVVLEGLAKAKISSKYTLDIVGKGSFEEELKQLSINLGLDDNINFLGWQPQSEVYKILMNCDIALIPHLRNEHTDNTSPNKIFQYMLAGKPILSSDCNYLKNIIDETKSGLVYKDVSSDDFSKNLQKLINDVELRESLGENGRKAILSKYNWDSTSKELLKLYNELK